MFIGKIKINNPIIQAALAGYTDRAMRMLARKFGCELTFSGVILDTSASYKPLLEKPNYIIRDDEHPIGAQLLGTEPEKMAAAAKSMVGAGYDIIDLNFACPAPKVLRRARGGAMLAEPQSVLEIYKRVRDAVSCPVMMKLRIGIDGSNEAKENFWYICNEAAAMKVDGLIVHGRTVEQGFKGLADWEVIKQLKGKYPNTTIIGSGDLFDPHDIVNKFKASGADGVAIARGAIGKPWIFRQVTDALEGKTEIFAPDIAQQGEIILEHFELLKEIYDSRKCIWHFRKFLTKYCLSHNTIKKARKELTAIYNEEQLKETIKKLYGL
ncbi:MAG: tRNA-dihydrouridine synthase family protein [Phycisphaerae bacterium]|nr:tRNA-dihydrouridine synthase family protein [Phycisphaerae bacterium]